MAVAPAKAFDIRRRVVSIIMFVAPLGVLIPVPGAPHSFRFYYLLLMISLLACAARGISRDSRRRLSALLPVLLYVTFSLVLIAARGSVVAEDDSGVEGNPAARALLLFLLIAFYVAACDQIKWNGWPELVKYIRFFSYGFAISIGFGYLFFVGFYIGIFSEEKLELFHVLLQFGFGLLRFSPGSYPNEYGVVASFALSLLVLSYVCPLSMVERRMLFGILARYRAVFAILTLGGLFLATTRAAYISFLLSMIYIASFFSKGIKKLKFTISLIVIGTIILSIASIFYDVIGIFTGGYEAFFESDSSAADRFQLWSVAFNLFGEFPVLGTGFGSVDMMHNTYLQIIIGLGILGTLCVVAAVATIWLLDATKSTYMTPCGEIGRFIRGVRVIGLLHIMWFAMSNHNLNHFLTWFVLIVCSGVSGRQIGSSSELTTQGKQGAIALSI